MVSSDNALVYSGGDLSKMNDFVYEQKAGEGIYIYVLDEGVQLDVKNVRAFHVCVIRDTDQMTTERH